jgi:CRISPR system Cascade subunit CasC
MPKFIEIHIIQTMPAGNPNRGEDGGVKDVIYGGVRRARLSSWAQKRVARLFYHKYGKNRDHIAVRSRLHVEPLAKKLAYWAEDKDRKLVARMCLNLFNVGQKNFFQALLEKDKNLLFLADHELTLIAEIINQNRETFDDWLSRAKLFIALNSTEEEQLEEVEPEDEVVELSTIAFDRHLTKQEISKVQKLILGALPKAPPGEVALFGRMMASLTETSVDGCVQVAHALGLTELPRFRGSGPDGTYKSGYVDFFSACDDMQKNKGAGMIGEVRFTSTTYYRYANVCVSEFQKLMGKNSGPLTTEMIGTFIEGFVKTLPEGHQSSFAHQTMPEFVLLQVKETAPFQYAQAFIEPLEYVADDGEKLGSIPEQAVSKLMHTRSAINELYGEEILAHAIVALPEVWDESKTLKTAIASVLQAAVES